MEIVGFKENGVAVVRVTEEELVWARKMRAVLEQEIRALAFDDDVYRVRAWKAKNLGDKGKSKSGNFCTGTAIKDRVDFYRDNINPPRFV